MKNSQKYLTDKQIEEMVECLMYVRDDNNAPIGMVVLTKAGEYGWSLFNEKLEPNGSMDKGKGILIACSRAGTHSRMHHDLHFRCRRREVYHPAFRLMVVWDTIERIRDWAKSKSGKEKL